MTQRKRSLGKGLGRGLGDLGLKELLNDIEKPVPTQSNEPTTTDPSSVRLCDLPIEKVIPGKYQPRKHFDEDALQELADSIKAQGVIQPIVVRQQGNHYELIAGERRWRAAQRVGLNRIPAIIRQIKDETAIALSLIENIQRSDLNPIEEAMALQRLIDEFDLTHNEVASAVGKSRTGVTNLLRLLKLSFEVKSFLEKGQLEMGHARALLALDQGQQSQAAHIIIARGLSVRETEKLVRSMLANKESIVSRPRQDPDIAHLQNNLADKLGAKVAIKHSQHGKGKLIIHYNSVDELDGILDHIK